MNEFPELPCLTSSELLIKLKTFNLTTLQKTFFISLYGLFKKAASFDSEKNMYYIEYSGRELANLFQLHFNTIFKALEALENCSLILRIPKSTAPNSTYVTYLNLETLYL